VLSQRWELPLLYEAVRLKISPRVAVRVREVELYIHDKAVVYARSIMPLQIYQQQRHTLQNIGTRPLGQLLFRDGRIRVSKRHVAVYKNGDHRLIYGRSTPYQYCGKEILVSEYFIDKSLL
jgi:chorismate--pyruvate lyase